MDMQGDPIGGNKSSTKHTTDPESHENPIQEGAGAVASDSLAADSARSGGAFGENRDSNPLSVPSNKSNFANTDTSAAKTIPPAQDASSRDDVYRESGAGEKYPEGAGGQGSFPGSHAGGSYAGGSTAAKEEFNSSSKGPSSDTSEPRGAFSDGGADRPNPDKISSGEGHTRSGGNASYSGTAGGNTHASSTSGQNYASNTSGPGGSTSGNAGSAPGYVSDVTQPFGQGKPKGRNITEGSEEDFKGPSDQDAEIGSENDPGRRAELDFQRMTQQSSGSTAPKQSMQSGGGSQYDTLQEDQQI